jgi:DTW domain-containing protein YfiP
MDSKIKLERKRKRKTKDPCPNCALHLDLCLCEHIPKLDLATKVSLIIHHKELKRTSNTGQLALKSLSNSTMYVRGLKNEPIDMEQLLSDEYETLLLFPTDDAEVLTPKLVSSIDKKIQIIVPDGNWRQASKVNTRYPELENIKRVKVARVGVDPYHLRVETTQDGMATLQAIAYALGAIEGEDIQNELLKLYDEKLVRTLVGRGKLPQSAITEEN